MSIIQDAAIQFYQWSAGPARWWRVRHWRQAGTMPVAVLFYHRVADEHPNPWTIATKAFAQHIDWLQAHFDIVSLSEGQHRLGPAGNSRPTVCITFDDGYADNHRFAIPLLIERRIPFTYFVTLGNVVEQRPFAHDLVRGVPMPVDTVEAIRALVNAGVEIGSHTRTHPDLGQITDEATLFDEVVRSTQELSELVETPIRYFAFPFGQRVHLNRRGAELARQHGIQGVCSAYGGFNFPGDEPFHLQRIHGDPRLSRLQNWLSFDQRVVRIPRFRLGVS